jgi:hypothetical protein
MAAAPVYFGTLENYFARITAAATQTTIVTAPTNGVEIESLYVASDDTSNQTATFVIYNGTNDYPLLVKSIPLGSGTSAGVGVVNILNLTDIPFLRYNANGNLCLILELNSVLKVTMAAVTGAKIFSFFATGRAV